MITCIGLEIRYPSGFVGFSWFSCQEDRSSVIMRLVRGEPIEGGTEPSQLVAIIDHVTVDTDSDAYCSYCTHDVDYDDCDPPERSSIAYDWEAQQDLAYHEFLFPNGYVDPLGDAVDTDDIPF